MAIYPSKKKTPITSITPSNISPVSISAGTNYTPSESGSVIGGYADVQPSDTNPPLLYKRAEDRPWYRIGNNGYLIATKNLPINYGTITVPIASLPTNISGYKTFEYQFDGFPRSGVASDFYTKLTIKNFAIKEIPLYKVHLDAISAGEYTDYPPTISITNYAPTGDLRKPFSLSFRVVANGGEYGNRTIVEFLDDLTINCYYTDFSSF